MSTSSKGNQYGFTFTRQFESSRHEHANLVDAFEQALPTIRRRLGPPLRPSDSSRPAAPASSPRRALP
jgi:hypothetical protein